MSSSSPAPIATPISTGTGEEPPGGVLSATVLDPSVVADALPGCVVRCSVAHPATVTAARKASVDRRIPVPPDVVLHRRHHSFEAAASTVWWRPSAERQGEGGKQRDEVHLAVRARLLEQPQEMGPHGRHGDPERHGDLGVGATRPEQLEDPRLGRREIEERGDRGERRRPWSDRGRNEDRRGGTG